MTALSAGLLYLDARVSGDLRSLGIEEAGGAKPVEPRKLFGLGPGAQSVDFADQPVEEAAVAGDDFRPRLDVEIETFEDWPQVCRDVAAFGFRGRSSRATGRSVRPAQRHRLPGGKSIAETVPCSLSPESVWKGAQITVESWRVMLRVKFSDMIDRTAFRSFDSFEEADRADRLERWRMTPDERMEVLERHLCMAA